MTHLRRLAALFSPLLLCGCGNPGLPLPPSLMLPETVLDLGATRVADGVTLRWTMPRRTTDRVLLKGDQQAAVCRSADAGPCAPVALLKVEAGKGAAFTDRLPASLREGPAVLLRYEVRLQNRAGHDAGPSNPAFAAAGWAPPAVRAATAEATAKGIAVHWQTTPVPGQVPAAGAHLLVRLVRDRILAAGEVDTPGKLETQAGVPQPLTQTLLATEHPPTRPGEGWTPATTLDADAAMLRRYRYTVQLVEQVTLNGHVVEVAGEAANTPVVEAKDVFPPAVPEQLAAVANVDGGTIDLAWNVAGEADLAGYVVYRREAGGPGLPVRVSGPALLPTPNWSDGAVRKGVRYAYAVSAVDTSGNESPRSPETEEQLPR